MIGTASAQVVMMDKAGTITPVKVAFRTLDKHEAAGYKAQAEQKVQIQRSGMDRVQTWSATLEGGVVGGGGMGTTPNKPASFSGIVREDGNYVFAFFDEVFPGMKVMICVERSSGGDCSYTIEFQEHVPPSPGNLFGIAVPVLPDHYGQVATAYQFRNGGMQTASTTVGAKRAKYLASAAYEKHAQVDAGGPTETVIQIAGNFHPDYPYTAFAGGMRLSLKILTSTEGTPRETLVQVLNQDALAQMGEVYLLTLCQFAWCDTVDVTHLPMMTQPTTTPQGTRSVDPIRSR